MNGDLAVRPMSRAEVGSLVEWAAREGWNPGLHDADIFWATDPQAFLAAELEGELIGGGAITAYAGRYGFMGFFIVRPAFRGRGFGNILWHVRRDRLIERLEPGATIGMDGVFDMQSYYAKGGFAFSHRNIRYRADVPQSEHGNIASGLVPLSELSISEIEDYDWTCFPAPRRAFLERWISQPDSQALGFVEDGRLAGYGVIRRCHEGCKIGPLFANDGAVAEALFAALTDYASVGPVFLDAPENNAEAMALVERHAMNAVFGCARMYLGPRPDVDESRVFGVTTFELG